MGFTYGFKDNESYGTTEINDITARLVGAGIAPFPAKDTYNPSDLNSLTGVLLSSGVNLDGCKCTVNTSAKQVTVGKGVIYFSDGTWAEVDAAGVTLDYTGNVTHYIYAVYYDLTQEVKIVCDTGIDTEGEVVELGAVSVTGVLSDRRAYARSKIATFGTNTSKIITISSTEPLDEYGRHYYPPDYVLHESDYDISKFNIAVCTYCQRSVNQSRDIQNAGAYSLSSGTNMFRMAYRVGQPEYNIISINASETVQSYFDGIWQDSVGFTLKKDGNRLVLTSQGIYIVSGYPIKLKIY
jgi:hypothetical protein